jgi:2-haloacid dehalogenase
VTGPGRTSVELVLLDVNETLFSLRPVAERMTSVGLEGQLELWFTRILRDGFAAAATGGFAGFRDLADHHLRELFRRHELPGGDAQVDHVLAGFEEVAAHPDVAAGLAALRSAGVLTVALTNGSASITTSFLERAGLTQLVDDVHDVSETGRWKPAPEPYLAQVARHVVRPEAAALIAVHPWDVFGAQSAGLVGAWLDRDGAVGYPEAFGRPDVHAATLDALVGRLSEWPDAP